MMHTRIPGYALLTLLLVATPAFARVVISEVLWMGSDQSTADEWVELAGVGGGEFGGGPWSLSGWTLASLGTDGTEKTIVRFLDISIDADQYVVVSNYPAAQSRLATEPMFTTTAMTLPNTKLLLRLRDGSGNIVDEVDDGVGVPFAGANPSGTGAKASMERLDLLGVGTVKENWQTAIATLGFDPGVPIFGTPGFPRIQNSSSSTPSFSSSSPSSIASSSVSSLPSSSSSSVAPAPHSSSQASGVGSSCASDVANPRIAIQSGEPRSEGKVTVNLQAQWEGKVTLRCTWDYGDGFTSASCNPPPHTFATPGQYQVRLEAEDACGGKGTQVLSVEVTAAREQRGSWRTGSQSSHSQNVEYARVTRVIDGDTVEMVVDGRTEIIRLLGIDAPEVRQGGRTEPWGRIAQETVRGLLEGAFIELTFDEEREDVYRRTLAYLAIRGHDIGAELLRQGLAEAYRKCRCRRKDEYFHLEEEARRRRVGMWERKDDEDEQENEEDKIPSPMGRGVVTHLRQGYGGQGGGQQGVGRETEGVNVVISEVYPVPLPAEGEWVELWNGGEEPLDLSGWKLDDAEGVGSRAWEFPKGFVLQPGVFIVLRSDQTHLALNNDGDSVALIAPNGAVVDRMTYGKLRRGGALARVIQRIGSTGEFRATERFCITGHPTPFERNICEEEFLQDEKRRRACTPECVPARRRVMVSKKTRDDTGDRSVPSKVRRVVRRARRVRYRNILPPDVASGSVVAADPLFASLIAQMDRSVQNGQVQWGEEDVGPGKEKTTEWEVMLLPLLLVVGVHGMLTGIVRKQS